ncbi:succinate dehydrogenase, subunit D [Augochlora pura]
MILERVISGNIFRKVRQLESLAKTSVFPNLCRPPQFAKPLTSLSGINRCLNSNAIYNGGNRFVTKFPKVTAGALQQSRNASTTGDHVRLWLVERIIAVALPIIIPTAIIMENAILDAVMSVLVVMHGHWGLEAVILDYARPAIVGPVLPKVLHIALLLISAGTLAGLITLIHNGPGVSTSIKNIWAIGKPKEEETPE